MGIYSKCSIFGIQIYRLNEEDDGITVLFEEKSEDTIMSSQQMREAYLLYSTLPDTNKIFFKFYTECSSTLGSNNSDNFMLWFPLSIDTFLEKFNI